jgi:hypothetical protein
MPKQAVRCRESWSRIVTNSRGNGKGRSAKRSVGIKLAGLKDSQKETKETKGRIGTTDHEIGDNGTTGENAEKLKFNHE